MTKPRHLHGCTAGSQASGITAYSPGEYAWNVNFNNGNANWNNQDNDNFVRAVRAVTECCMCVTSLLAVYFTGLPLYRVESLDACYREDVLKKIGGEGSRIETTETRDAPVAA